MKLSLNMKTLTFILIFNLLLISANASTDKKIAMVFNGGGFKTAMFLGMLKGSTESGIKPDVIIGTCGGSIPAAIAHTLETSDQQLEFIQSEEFYNLLKSIEFTKYASVGKTLLMAKDFYTKYRIDRIIPDIYNNFLMKVPMHLQLESISNNFVEINHRTVIIASKILYKEQDSGNKRSVDQELFQESIFTDADTANKLQGIEAPASHYINTSVAQEMSFITDANVEEAARASISDPFYMAPGEFNGDRFVTGAVDLYPFEIAKKLADEIIFAYPPQFDIVEQGAILATFGFPQNKRRAEVFNKKIEYLIDYTDFPSELDFTPKPNFLTWKMKSRIPLNYEEYRSIIKKQYDFGYTRALEAAKHKNSKSHIRNL